MTDKERRINERSLENLKLGAQARYQGKARHNFTVLPETVEWLKATGNASDTIDALVAAARDGGLKSSNTHNWKDSSNSEISSGVYERMKELEAENSELRSQLEKVEASKKLHLDLESVRDRVVSRWRLQRRAESKERIEEALSKFIAELRSSR
jgi:hypothetical protein